MPKCEPVGLDFIDRARVVAKVSVSLKASPAQVWQVLNDTDRWPEWFDGMKTARVTSAEWDGIGSTRQVKVGPLTIDEKMVAWEPEQQWGFSVTDLNVIGWVAKRMLEVVDIEPAGTGSLVTYTGAVDPVLWLRPTSSLLKKQFTAAWQTSLPNIDNQIAS
ncbi:MAG: carbon monoxide dehydrogenase subunit G [Thermoproteota archaeon]|jgi:carbon monoxide dehydrogenase subunit G